MISLSRFLSLMGTGAFLFGLASPTTAFAQAKTLGTIERLDKGLDALLPEGATIEILVPNKFVWSEGPAWDAVNKRVVFSDVPENIAWQWSEAGGLKEFLKPSGYTGKEPFTGKEPGSNGLMYNKAGELVLCQHGDRRLARLVDGKFVTLVDKYEGKRLNSPNDLALKSNGDIYFTDPPYGLPKLEKDPTKEIPFQGVYRVTPKGEITLLTKEMTKPNGIAFSPDQKTLYVANSDPDKSLWMKYPVKEDGTLGEGSVFADTTELVKQGKKGLPDGLKVDTKGNVWATGPGGVFIYTAEGKHLGTLATGVPTGNVVFGDDGSTLYIAADKSFCRVKTKVKGW
jgi:gluconolactonase